MLTELDKILNCRYMLLSGGRYCGKTQFAARTLAHLCFSIPNFKGIWGLAIKDRMGESARPMFQRIIGKNNIINDSEDRIELKNGSIIRFRAFNMERGLDANGLDDVDLLVVDESQKMSQATVDNIIDSVRNERGTSAIWFVLNPMTLKDPASEAVKLYDGLCYHLDYRDNAACPPDKYDDAEKLRVNNPSLWRRRMLGFPDTADPDSLLVPSDFDYEIKDIQITGQVQRIAGYDPAGDRGDDNCLWVAETDSTGLTKEYAVLCWTGIKEMESVAKVREFVIEHRISAIAIDCIGIGSGMADRLREMLEPRGVKVYRFKSSYSSRNPAETRNERDRIFLDLRRAVLAKEFIIDDGATITELSAHHYKQTSAGFVQIEPKDSIKKILHRSPNRADAAAMALYARQQNVLTFLSDSNKISSKSRKERPKWLQI